MQVSFLAPKSPLLSAGNLRSYLIHSRCIIPGDRYCSPLKEAGSIKGQQTYVVDVGTTYSWQGSNFRQSSCESTSFQMGKEEQRRRWKMQYVAAGGMQQQHKRTQVWNASSLRKREKKFTLFSSWLAEPDRDFLWLSNSKQSHIWWRSIADRGAFFKRRVA